MSAYNTLVTDTGDNALNPNSAYIANQIVNGSGLNYPYVKPNSNTVGGNSNVGQAFDNFISDASDFISNAGQVVHNAYDNVVQWLEDHPGVEAALSPIGYVVSHPDQVHDAYNTVSDAISNLFSGSTSGSPSGGSYSGSGASVSSSDSSDPFQSIIDLINNTTAANNAWSANQAQINRDWQKMMSDTAHQREVADLKAAGLNPVLSATGGNGASTPTGAMAQTDTSNTRLLAEVSLQALEAAQANAAALGRIASQQNANTILGKIGQWFGRNGNYLGRVAASAAIRYGVHAALAALF